MPERRLFQNRADRLIGWARVIVAAGSGAALCFDPPAARTTASALAGGYLAIAAAALPLARHLRYPAWYGKTLHTIDLAVFTALVYLTEGPGSPFFLLFNFSILAATLKWRWRGALWTSAAVLALF